MMELVLLMQPLANQLHAHLILASCVQTVFVLQTGLPAILPQMPAPQAILLNVQMVFVSLSSAIATPILITLHALLVLSFVQMDLVLQTASAHFLMVALLPLHLGALLVTALTLLLETAQSLNALLMLQLNASTASVLRAICSASPPSQMKMPALALINQMVTSFLVPMVAV